MLPLEGFKEAQEKGILINSNGALNLKEVPKSLVIIGGGGIGVEIATLYNIFGSKVTIIEGGSSIIAPMDKDIRKFATEKLLSNGVEILTNAKVLSMDGNKVNYEINGEVKSVEGEKVLLSVGRRPNNLNLDKTLGMEVDKRGAVVVNENFQTSIPNIFAQGDVNGLAMVAHASYKHADIITEFFKGNKMV
uniref:dihydrolipoyl dehydrogenase n=1 Tax=Biomphalaria glabrata TaxID=6526 RepID=A0A2C9L3B0_BIOGL